jgi:hypothetical protein
MAVVHFDQGKEVAYTAYADVDAKDIDTHSGADGDAVFGTQGEGHVNYTSMGW